MFDPSTLYETLDNSEAGIAEWIVPLVYAGHCEEIVWVKPEFSDQMVSGRKLISVGKKSDESIGIDSKEPYFVDDFMFQKRCDMSNVKQNILLDVQTAKRRPRCSGRPYVLDICLDYFSTKNPFALELKKRFDSKTIELIYHVYQKPKYRGVKTRLCHAEQIRDRTYFEVSMTKLISLCDKKCRSSSRKQNAAELEALLEKMATRLYDDVPSARVSLRGFARFIQNLETLEDKNLVSRNGPMLDLPDHVSDMDEMKRALDDMKSYLSRILSNRRGSGCPCMITIACSLDGYTPKSQLKFLLTSVLNIITELYVVKKTLLDISVVEHAPKHVHDVVREYYLL